MDDRRRVRCAALGLAVVLIAACASGSDEADEVTAGQAPPNGSGVVPAELTGRVVAGGEAGWLADRDGQVWRIDTEGTVEQTTVEIPAYNSGFSTFFAGKVVFAGTRCDGRVQGEACDGESVVELRLLDEIDQSVETVELFRETGGYRRVGVGLLGTADDELWIYTNVGDVSVVAADGSLTDMDIASGPGTPSKCLIGGELYGLDDASDADDVDAGPAPTAYEPGDQATATEETWTVTRWDGSAWTPVPGGVYARQGEEASMRCTADGFVLRAYGVDAPYASFAAWTPDDGWRQPEPSIERLTRNAVIVSSTHSGYVADPEGLRRVDLDDGLTATPMSAARLQGAVDPASIEVVDDAGTVLIACVEQSDNQTHCAVTPDE